MIPDISPWPVSYRVRTSTRARSIRLRVEAGRGLEVVLPKGTDPARIPAVLERHRDWIEKTLRKYQVDGPLPTASLPETLVLHNGLAVYPVATGPVRSAVLFEGRILVPREDDIERQLGRLRDWVRGYAREYLEERLLALAGEFGFSVRTVRVRWQKSRWGSCSARGAINLNAALVFFPEELSRVVMLHELAHLRHLDHSPDFWKTLFAMEPRALELDKRLRHGWKFLPPWLLTQS